METISNFVMVNDQQFKRLFKVEFLDDAVNFLSRIDPRAAKKILYNINKASFTRDPVLLKKVSEKFGSSEPDIATNNIGCLPLGISGNLVTL